MNSDILICEHGAYFKSCSKGCGQAYKKKLKVQLLIEQELKEKELVIFLKASEKIKKRELKRLEKEETKNRRLEKIDAKRKKAWEDIDKPARPEHEVELLKEYYKLMYDINGGKSDLFVGLDDTKKSYKVEINEDIYQDESEEYRVSEYTDEEWFALIKEFPILRMKIDFNSKKKIMAGCPRG